MNCAELRELLGRVPLESARPEIAPHLDGCPACREEVELLDRVVRELPSVALEPSRRYDLSPRRRLRWAPWVAAAAALVALAFLWIPSAAPPDLADRYAAHVEVSRDFFRQAANLRGEDPARDARLAAAEWAGSGLEDSTKLLAAHAGRLPAEQGNFVRECVSISRALKEGRLEAVRAVKPPAGTGVPAAVLAPGRAPEVAGEAGRFLEARLRFYSRDYEGAATLFDRFLAEFPSSAYAADAAYWKSRAAAARGDEPTLMSAIERITEEEWVDDQVIACVRSAMQKPGARVMRASDGRVMVLSPAGGTNLSLPPAVAGKVFANAVKRVPEGEYRRRD